MRRKIISLFLILASIIILISSTHSQEPTRQVMVVKVNSVINPVSSEFIEKSLKKAKEMNAEAVVIELDTPGGLDTSMRSIVKNIIASDVPVIVYVSPSGARAASAGVFITLAAHVAAMAPGTNIGAAHPVGVGGKMDETMVEKATNDAVAYVKSLAERTGRNAEWAEESVRKSVSATETEALEKNVIDIVSKDLPTLLKDIDGRTVALVSGERTLMTAQTSIVSEEMNFRFKILNFISDPSVAYMLLLLGFYGIFFELTNPGAIFPGVVGAIALILAFYSFQTLPVNYAGILLIVLAIILFILEIKVTSFGMLTIGGIITMIFGSLMLFDSPSPFFKLSLYLVLPTVMFTALFFTIVVGLVYRAHRKKPVTGKEGLVGLEGTANTDITTDDGMAALHGELWSAHADEPIAKGDKIIVVSVSGLKIKVRKVL
jgi:membrane-bound serine protease (ClpP class)